MSPLKRSLIAGGCILCALFLIASSSRSTGGEYTQPNHCYALLSSMGKDGSSQVLESACFSTFSDAIYTATRGRVNLDPSIRPEEVTDSILNRVSSTDMATTQVVIGIDWDYSNYGGSSFTWAVSDTGCTPTLQYSAPSMPSGWNDRVSSAKAYSGCLFSHYQDLNFGGSTIACTPNCASFGSLDNATSSEKWIYSP